MPVHCSRLEKHIRTWTLVQDLFQCLIENGLDRKSLVVALGGGVTGDLIRIWRRRPTFGELILSRFLPHFWHRLTAA